MYNVQNFLSECLDSIANQTLKNFKVLLIDDGSTDKTKDIAKKYVKKYPALFSYQYQENKGLGGARNTGIALAKSKYCLFLDSDDFLSTTTIEHLTQAIIDNYEPDIVITAPTIYNSATQTYSPFFDNERLEWLFKDKAVTNVEETPGLLALEASFWRCIWRTEFLKESNFPFLEHVSWEDVPPHFVLFHRAKRIMRYSYFPTFFYRINTGNQITASTGKNRLDVPVVFNQVITTMHKEKWKDEDVAHVIKMLATFVSWSISVIDDSYREEFVSKVHKLYRTLTKRDYRAYKQYIKPSFKERLIYKTYRSNHLHKLLFDRSKTVILEKRYNTFKKIVKKVIRKGSK